MCCPCVSRILVVIRESSILRNSNETIKRRSTNNGSSNACGKENPLKLPRKEDVGSSADSGLDQGSEAAVQ